MTENNGNSTFEVPDYEFICKLVGHLYIENLNLQRKGLSANPSNIEEILRENKELKKKLYQQEKVSGEGFGMGSADVC